MGQTLTHTLTITVKLTVTLRNIGTLPNRGGGHLPVGLFCFTPGNFTQRDFTNNQFGGLLLIKG